MGFWDNIGSALNSINDAMEKKEEEIKKRVARELRNKTEHELENMLHRAEEQENWKLEELIKNELNRRGIY